MMNRFTIIVACAAAMSAGIALGQPGPTLKVKNPSKKDVMMWYGSRSRSNVEMKKARIPAKGSAVITLSGDDPWNVQCYRPGDVTQQVQISDQSGVNLVEIARTNQPFELDLTYTNPTGRNGRRQIMSARLKDETTGDQYRLFADAGEVSDFAQGVLDTNWHTQFTSGNNQNVAADVDLENIKFTTPQFTGRFHHLAVHESDTDCLFVARWSAANPNEQLGDVYFTVDKNQPDALKGFYTFDNRPGQQFPWNSR